MSNCSWFIVNPNTTAYDLTIRYFKMRLTGQYDVSGCSERNSKLFIHYNKNYGPYCGTHLPTDLPLSHNGNITMLEAKSMRPIFYMNIYYETTSYSKYGVYVPVY